MDPKKRKLASRLFIAAGVLVAASVFTDVPIRDEDVPSVIVFIVAVVLVGIGLDLGTAVVIRCPVLQRVRVRRTRRTGRHHSPTDE